MENLDGSESTPLFRKDRIRTFFEDALQPAIFERFAPFIDELVIGRRMQAERTLARTLLFICEALELGVIDAPETARFFRALVEFKTDLDVGFSPWMEAAIQEGSLAFADGRAPEGDEALAVVRVFSGAVAQGTAGDSLLVHHAVTVRFATAEILAEYGSADDLPRIKRLLEDPDPGIKSRASFLIWKLQIRLSDDRIGAMLEYLRRSPLPHDRHLREWIYDQLVASGGTEALSVLREVSERDGDPNARAALVRLVERLRDEGSL